MSLIALLLMFLIRFKIPDFAPQSTKHRFSLHQVFTLAGIRSVLAVVLIFVLAHNILYTFIVPFLSLAQLAARTDLILLIFGLSSVIGIWIMGLWIDRYLRVLALISTTIFAATALALTFSADTPQVVYISIAFWGLSFGGAGTLFQTALAKTAGDATDVAQAMLVTVWNIAIAIGSILGGILLDKVGVQVLPPVIFVLLIVTFIIIWKAKKYGFTQ